MEGPRRSPSVPFSSPRRHSPYGAPCSHLFRLPLPLPPPLVFLFIPSPAVPCTLPCHQLHYPRGSDLICRVLGLVCVVRAGSCLGLPSPTPPMMFVRRSTPSLTPTTDVVREANLAKHDGEIVAKLQAPPCSTSRRITTIYMDWVMSLESQTCDGRMR